MTEKPTDQITTVVPVTDREQLLALVKRRINHPPVVLVPKGVIE